MPQPKPYALTTFGKQVKEMLDAVAAERARVRRELLEATAEGLEELHMRQLLDRICPEEG